MRAFIQNLHSKLCVFVASLSSAVNIKLRTNRGKGTLHIFSFCIYFSVFVLNRGKSRVKYDYYERRRRCSRLKREKIDIDSIFRCIVFYKCLFSISFMQLMQNPNQKTKNEAKYPYERTMFIQPHNVIPNGENIIGEQKRLANRTVSFFKN